jgi:exodeoxyribonuclease VII large subunit
MPDSVWVVAELSDFKRRSNGHVYMDLLEAENGKEVAKAKATMFATVAGKILAEWERVTGGLPQAGMKVLVKVRAELSPQYGFSLNVTGLDPSYTLGDMQAKLQEIISTLKGKGWFDLQRGLPSPKGYWRIAVISPQDAAGLADFRRDAQQLDDAGVCGFDYYTATFQGKDTSESIRAALKAVHERHQVTGYDAVCIIRGGGAKSDLAQLNDATLGAWVCRLPIPVYSGIGHEIDECLIDLVAHRKFDTPSKVIGYIRSALIAEANGLRAALQTGKASMLALAGGERPLLERRWGEFSRLVRGLTHRQQQIALQARGRVDVAVGRLISGQRLQLDRRASDLGMLGRQLCGQQRQQILLAGGRAKSAGQARVVRERSQLEMASMLYDKTNPLALLGRGFALVRDAQGDIVTSAGQAVAAGELSLTFADDVISVQVQDIATPDPNTA